MTKSLEMGLTNRTGMQRSPIHAKELLEGFDVVEGAVAVAEGDGAAMAELRIEYINEADPLGTIPAPVTVKGMAKAGAQMLKGDRPQMFIDKLAERLAFERSGTRLYDAVIAKYRGQALAAETEHVSQQRLLEIRDQEAQHFRLLAGCIEKMGGDPTAQTPCADLVGIESMGLMQAVSDPRTTFVQSLHSVLAAELIDVAGWDLLAQLADSIDQEEMAEQFRAALLEEQEHLNSVRGWYEALTLQESTRRRVS
jgi:rubrerythrin